LTAEHNNPNQNESTYYSNLVGATTQAPTPPDNCKTRANEECPSRQGKSNSQIEAEKMIDEQIKFTQIQEIN
jgi:hypothetical protein